VDREVVAFVARSEAESALVCEALRTLVT